jgi:shikimate kinase
MNDKNIVLIGMPAVGKSAVGAVLAEVMGRPLVDTDQHLESRHRRPLHMLLDINDPEAFCRLEEQAVCALDCRGSVIATGGSVIYGEKAMAHLRAHGLLIYLYAPLALIEMRINDMSARGVVRRPYQTLADVFRERDPVYRRHAEITVDRLGASVRTTVLDILTRLAQVGFTQVTA